MSPCSRCRDTADLSYYEVCRDQLQSVDARLIMLHAGGPSIGSVHASATSQLAHETLYKFVGASEA